MFLFADAPFSHIVGTRSTPNFRKNSVACPRDMCKYRRMNKSVFIKVRVTPEEKQAFLAAADARKKPLSEIIRASLARMVKRGAA